MIGRIRNAIICMWFLSFVLLCFAMPYLLLFAAVEIGDHVQRTHYSALR